MSLSYFAIRQRALERLRAVGWRWSSKFRGVPWWLRDLEASAGVYVFWAVDQVWYVGASASLGMRLQTSVAERCAAYPREPWFASYCPMPDAAAAFSLETALIKRLQPYANVARPQVADDARFWADSWRLVPLNLEAETLADFDRWEIWRRFLGCVPEAGWKLPHRIVECHGRLVPEWRVPRRREAFVRLHDWLDGREFARLRRFGERPGQGRVRSEPAIAPALWSRVLDELGGLSRLEEKR